MGPAACAAAVLAGGRASRTTPGVRVFVLAVFLFGLLLCRLRAGTLNCTSTRGSCQPPCQLPLSSACPVIVGASSPGHLASQALAARAFCMANCSLPLPLLGAMAPSRLPRKPGACSVMLALPLCSAWANESLPCSCASAVVMCNFGMSSVPACQLPWASSVRRSSLANCASVIFCACA